ncbi:MAG: hypothetical protein K8S98_18235 [Planctomycetes bacterium]|nr:hypothetical protein [Planctomycetota bacterium]
MPALAFANNDVAYLWWDLDAKIPNCLGFAIERIDVKTGKSKFLESMVGFVKKPNTKREFKETTVWPIQKFQWKDVFAPRGGTYRYRITPMVGTATKLKKLSASALETGAVSLIEDYGPVSVWFNRGIISTQAVSDALPKSASGSPNPNILRDRINQPHDPLRERLAAEVNDALLAFLERPAKRGGKCYAALYELSDAELVTQLMSMDAATIEIVLSNTGADDATNEVARQSLHAAHKTVTDRMLGNGHIGHNKFVVWVDKHGTPKAVLTGSTNWTPTGLCAQTNNVIMIESETLAKQYLAYWKALRDDKAQQAAVFRTANAVQRPEVSLGAKKHGKVRVWFSPNTKQKTKSAAKPVDMGAVFDVIDGARNGVLFLAFIPGTPSLLTQIRATFAARKQKGKPFFVRGALTDSTEAEKASIDLYHRSPKIDANVSGVQGIGSNFSYWEKELYKLGHAVIHDKIIVVDPFSDDCAVITGSHNEGYKASYANDENLLILRGNRAVAEAYAAHVLDIYDHFRWRWAQKTQGAKVWKDLDETDAWQDKYYGGSGSADRLFFQP